MAFASDGHDPCHRRRRREIGTVLLWDLADRDAPRRSVNR